MDVSIEVADKRDIATSAEIIGTHLELAAMQLTMSVGFFNATGNKLFEITVDHELQSLPIPSVEEQWAIVTPAIEAYQAAHPAPLLEQPQE